MEIDLLINKEKDLGLVSTGKLPDKISGIIFDHQTRTLSLEFGATMDSLDLNVEVDDEFIPFLTDANYLFYIGTDKTHIHEAYRVPLAHVNDLSDDMIGEWR